MKLNIQSKYKRNLYYKKKFKFLKKKLLKIVGTANNITTVVNNNIRLILIKLFLNKINSFLRKLILKKIYHKNKINREGRKLLSIVHKFFKKN